MDFVQISMVLFGASSIWFITRKESWSKWGNVLGLIGQPFWFYAAITTQQWGILILTCFYTYSWIQGIYNNIILKLVRK